MSADAAATYQYALDAALYRNRGLCVLNRCGRPQGIGTWCQIVGIPDPQPVCEEHWQAMRDIFPVEVTADA